MTEPHWSDDVVTPALLRFAWRSYGGATRAALADAGFDDLPRNGAFVVGGMARNSVAMEAGGPETQDLARGLGVSKQAVSQLLDSLVTRGYLTRAPDPEDRRRLTITLTERGEAAAHVISAAGTAMDTRVERALGAEQFAGFRRALGVLIDTWRDEHVEDD